MEFSSEALCREKQGGGNLADMCTPWPRMAQTSAPPPLTNPVPGLLHSHPEGS